MKKQLTEQKNRIKLLENENNNLYYILIFNYIFKIYQILMTSKKYHKKQILFSQI